MSTPITAGSRRYRINVARSTTGKMSWECTTDVEGASMEEVMEESNKLVALLEVKYPPPEGQHG